MKTKRGPSPSTMGMGSSVLRTVVMPERLWTWLKNQPTGAAGTIRAWTLSAMGQQLSVPIEMETEKVFIVKDREVTVGVIRGTLRIQVADKVIKVNIDDQDNVSVSLR